MPPNHSFCTGFPPPGILSSQLFSSLSSQLTSSFFKLMHPTTNATGQCFTWLSFLYSLLITSEIIFLICFLVCLFRYNYNVNSSTVSLTSSPLYSQYLDQCMMQANIHQRHYFGANISWKKSGKGMILQCLQQDLYRSGANKRKEVVWNDRCLQLKWTVKAGPSPRMVPRPGGPGCPASPSLGWAPRY